jgi:hypothetical protein
MDYKSRFVIVFVGMAALFVAGCAVEVPKSALPGFRLTPPQTEGLNPGMSKPTDPNFATLSGS